MRSVLAFVLLAGSAAHADSTCPIVRLKTKPPAIARAKNIDAARALLLKKSTAMEHEVDIMEPAKDKPAFAVAVRRGYEHGSSTTNWDSAAVFQLSNGVFVAQRLASFQLYLTAQCSPPLQDKVLDAHIATVGRKQIGIVRIRRVDTNDSPRLPAVAYAGQPLPECSATDTYRIEDHYLDLNARKELLVLASTYDGPVYEEHAPPVPALAAVQLSSKAIIVDAQQCQPFAWRP